MVKLNSFVCLFLFLLIIQNRWILLQLLKADFWGHGLTILKDDRILSEDDLKISWKPNRLLL